MRHWEDEDRPLESGVIPSLTASALEEKDEPEEVPLTNRPRTQCDWLTQPAATAGSSASGLLAASGPPGRRVLLDAGARQPGNPLRHSMRLPEVRRMVEARPGARLTAAHRIRLMLSGQDAIVVACLDQLFAKLRDFEVVGRCGKGENVLRAVQKLQPDILLLDLPPVPSSGLELLREMKRLKLPARVVFVAGTLEEGELLEAVRLGLRGVVPKDVLPSELALCVRKVHAGGIWLGPGGAAIPARTVAGREEAPRREGGSLTPREIEIVRLVCTGMRNREIALRLGIGEGTIKTHLHQIYDKLQLSGRLQLGLYGREKGLA